MVYEPRRNHDIDRSRDHDYRDTRRERPERRESSWDDNGRYTISDSRAPERARTWERPREQPREQQRERSALTSPTTSTTTRNDTMPELFPYKQPSSAASKQPPPTLPSGTLSARATKSILDLIVQRSYWYIRGEETEKARKKATAAYEKCRLRPSDFGGSLEFLEQQKKLAEDEKAKVDARIGDIDDILKPHLDQLFQKLKSESINQATPAAVSIDQAGLEARLIAARASMKQDLKEMLMKETGEMNQKVEKIYESRVSGLQECLAQESRKNAVLEQKLLDLERRLEELGDARSPTINDTDMSMDGAPSVNALDELTKSQSEQIDHLATRVDRIEESLSQIQNLAKQVDDHDKAIKQHTDKQTESDTALASLQSTVSKFPIDHLENALEKLSNTKAQDQSTGTSPTTISTDMVLQIIQPCLMKVEVTMKDSVQAMQQRLAPFLESERVSREALEKHVNDVDDRASGLRNDIDALKSENLKTAESIDKLSGISDQHAKELPKLSRGIMSAITRVDGLVRDSKSNFDSINLQLQNVNVWQNNFDTKPLYRDIVNHINTTLPEGMAQKLKALTVRVDAVENLFHDENGTMKKRKLQNGNPGVVNGHH